MIFETHAHYDDESFNDDREALIRSLPEKGIGRIINVGASIETTKTTLELAAKYDYIYAAVGVHPEDIERLTPEDMQWLADLTHRDKVVAIGEIGLDYYYDEPGRDLQKKWFARQLQVAAETQMPVIIHSRDAAKDTLDIMNEHCDWQNGGVIHCFSYSPEIAKIYLDKGFYLGIGGVVTFKNSKKLKEVVEMMPLSQMVLETDSPYLTPVPHRGKRNDSGYLTHVVDEIAALKSCEREEIIRITRENAHKLYRIGQ